MTPEQIRALGPALGRFLERFLFCCGDTRTLDHLGTYCRGLLSDLARKSVEPIALAAGVAVRTLQELLRDHLWDHHQVRTLLQQHVAAELSRQPGDDLGTVGIFDESGTPKKGTKTPGVQRQWCGATGEVKYFAANAPADTPLEKLLRVAFCRWNVEHEIRVGKSELGFGHYEGRHYLGLLRHLILCLLAMIFVAGQTQRLRGEKSGGPSGASVPGPEYELLGVA